MSMIRSLIWVLLYGELENLLNAMLGQLLILSAVRQPPQPLSRIYATEIDEGQGCFQY